MKAAEMLRGWNDRAIESFLTEAASLAEANERLTAEVAYLEARLQYAEHCAAGWKGKFTRPVKLLDAHGNEVRA